MSRPLLSPPGRAVPPRTSRSEAAAFQAKRHLAGKIAHDLNNYLTAILGYGELLDATLAENPKAERFLQEMIRGGERARAFAQQLQAFSGKQVLDPRRVQVNDLAREAEASIRAGAGQGIEVVMDLDPEAGAVEVDRGQMRHVLLTLVDDALRAMEGTGRLLLATAAVTRDADDDGRVEICVADTSGRWGAEARRRYFEPFHGRQAMGDGLSRAAAFGIVDQMGGRIVLEDAPEGGRLFRIQLPSCL